MPIYGNQLGLHTFRHTKIDTDIRYGNQSGLQMYTQKFIQLVYIALNITIYCLHIYKHLLYFLCVQILICTNRTECHRTRITGEENTCKQRARWALYGDLVEQGRQAAYSTIPKESFKIKLNILIIFRTILVYWEQVSSLQYNYIPYKNSIAYCYNTYERYSVWWNMVLRCTDMERKTGRQKEALQNE